MKACVKCITGRKTIFYFYLLIKQFLLIKPLPVMGINCEREWIVNILE